MYVRVVVNIPADKTFSYAVPKSLEKDAAVGKRVIVPFGKRVLTGYILETTLSVDVDNIKEIVEIPDAEPLFGNDDLRFYRWVSRYYLYPLGKTLFEILPDSSGLKKEKIISLIPQAPSSALQEIRITEKQRQMVDFLRENGDVSLPILRQHFENAAYRVGCLKKKGIIRTEDREVYRSSAESAAIFTDNPSIVLNGEQKEAYGEILQRLMTRRFSPCLLHGVTGSGKTEVYLQAMEKTREQGGGVIFLVPEIGLTPQLISRIGGRFGRQEVAIIHSGISRSVRYGQWHRIRRGEVRVVVGARSALFVPMHDLQLIIVDEEHDYSYKQDDRLRYNARDMAIVKAKLSDAAVVLGSATPGVQTYFNALKKKYHYLSLPQRIQCRAMPRVEIVDMKAEMGQCAELSILSRALKEAIGLTMAAKKQTLLFLNRRGFDTVVLCPDCGHVFKCPNCELSLKHHAAYGILKCHYCDFAVKAFPPCTVCGGIHIRSYGVGTEKLAEEVKRLFPEARIERMDSDTTAHRGDAERILRAVAQQEVDILVGTQMITKGHDFPGITLVGVVSADLSLNIPDFRAAETTFQILTQVAGRGGRGDMPGKVIIQTFNPDHYAVRRAQNHDYHGFYEDEIRLRKILCYPPYARLVNLHMTSLRKEEGKSGVEKIGKLVRSIAQGKGMANKMEMLGPAESPVSKIKGRYRWQLLLKGRDIKAQCAVVDAIRAEAKKLGLDVRVDVDPINFM